MRVAVVGPCASGKTTIAAALTECGFDAYVVGQEHSDIHWLWQRQQPDAVVFLDVPLEVIRIRRGADWPLWLFERQLKRLQNARDNANVVIQNVSATPSEIAVQISDELRESNSTSS
jgi:gluconate kinase